MTSWLRAVCLPNFILVLLLKGKRTKQKTKKNKKNTEKKQSVQTVSSPGTAGMPAVWTPSRCEGEH